MGDAAALLALIAGVAGALAADVIIFAAFRRAAPRARRLSAHAAGATGAIVVGFACFASTAVPAGWLVPGLAMVACNSYIGFHLDNMAETARRIRILRELEESPGGLTREAIIAAYPPQEVFERRIGRLKRAGQCIEEDGRLRATGGSYSLMGSAVARAARVVFGPGAERKL